MAQKATDQNLSTAMEYDWVKVRQSVAERVLTRHLDDLEQRDMRTGRRQRATSCYVADNSVVTTEPMVAATRRRSLPSGPHRRVDFQPESPTYIPRNPAFPEEDSTSDILELMTTTLLQAREVEEGRSSLYLQTRTSQSKGANGREAAPTRRKSYHDRLITLDNPPVRHAQSRRRDDMQLPRHTDGKPALERGETFIRTDEAQTLSLDDSKDPAPTNAVTSSDVTKADHNGHAASSDKSSAVSATRKVSQIGDGKPEAGKDKELVNGKIKGQQPNAQKAVEPTSAAVGPRTSVRGSTAAEVGPMAFAHWATPGAEREQSLGPAKKTSTGKTGPKPFEDVLEGNTTVEFYDEHVGFQPTADKGDGGFTPQSLSLPLKDLKDDTDDDDTDNDDKPEDSSDAETPQEGQDSWQQVKKCRYIRGYDPPEMLMPNDTVSFVFNGK